MKRARILTLTLVIIILAASTSLLVSYTSNNPQQSDPVYVGVAYGGNSTTQAKLIIDKTKAYTNLFILDSGVNRISLNETASRELCDYAVDAGLNIIVNMGSWDRFDWSRRMQFFNFCKSAYGDKFLGAYFDDEPAGIHTDYNWTEFFEQNKNHLSGTLKEIYKELQKENNTNPQNYTREAKWFNHLVENNPGHIQLKNNTIRTFTSDYALFWYDYLGGYDTVLAQVGWNHSLDQDIAQIRGAATMQNKDWGAIITWKYYEPPYLDTGENIYNQLKTVYNAGAKYILIFDLAFDNATGNPYGTMTQEHFDALEKFWTQDITRSTPNAVKAQAVLVLPKDYGWAMRHEDDKIWGFWGPDEKSALIWENLNKLLEQYGSRLDIIYEDATLPIQGKYPKIYYWNQTSF
ncbi:MAG: hypothetical protein NWE95_05305 [Candidatus Bathyarchaeota archaeon]|nr:hypothetical protein [Candidatus Bathyarchaeota archaeon]